VASLRRSSKLISQGILALIYPEFKLSATPLLVWSHWGIMVDGRYAQLEKDKDHSGGALPGKRPFKMTQSLVEFAIPYRLSWKPVVADVFVGGRYNYTYGEVVSHSPSFSFFPPQPIDADQSFHLLEFGVSGDHGGFLLQIEAKQSIVVSLTDPRPSIVVASPAQASAVADRWSDED
jgi:hypothetical protein